MQGSAAVAKVCEVAAAALAILSVSIAAPHDLAAQTQVQRQAIAEYDCKSPQASRAASIAWNGDDGAVKWGEWRIAVGSNAIPILVIVAVVAPGRTTLALDIARNGDEIAPWTVASAPLDARFALNAGQFTDTGPWGWVVHRGREHQPPGVGSLAGALIVDSAGRWSLLDAHEIAARRGKNVLEAVQSYPTLLSVHGGVSSSLCAGSDDINRSHRDTRLAVGTLPNGDLIIAMTRFDGLGAAIGRLPIGPTTPEMISIMRALGATRALMLDGGLSAQLMIRTGASTTKTEWPGLRGVPLALVGIPRK